MAITITRPKRPKAKARRVKKGKPTRARGVKRARTTTIVTR